MNGSAVFELDYRYYLSRRWADGGRVCWIMLNPSTADAERDDPTIRRCIGFSRDWGYGGLSVVNLFALIATDPYELRQHPTPIGTETDRYIDSAVTDADLVVAAWGNHGALFGRGYEVALRVPFGRLNVLGMTSKGQPSHPLYLPKTTRPVPWFIEIAEASSPMEVRHA